MSADATHVIEVHVPCADDAEAARIAAALVEQRLAACAQRLPIRSTYRWDGAVVDDEEVLLLAKSTEAQFPAIVKLVEEMHSYDLPAISAVVVSGGSQRYLDWVADSTG